MENPLLKQFRGKCITNPRLVIRDKYVAIWLVLKFLVNISFQIIDDFFRCTINKMLIMNCLSTFLYVLIPSITWLCNFYAMFFQFLSKNFFIVIICCDFYIVWDYGLLTINKREKAKLLKDIMSHGKRKNVIRI